MIGFFDGLKYFQFNTIEAFFDKVIRHSYRGNWIFSHFGGKYDHSFYLKELNRRKISYSLIQTGPKILCIKVKLGRDNINFVDSSGILNASLEKLCASFNTKTKKLVGSIDFENGERVDKNNPLHQKYLEHDCRSLFEVISNYYKDKKINESGMKISAASQSLDIFRRMMKTSIKVTTQEQQNFVREGYYGGRTEVFKFEGHGLNSYDANSLYPFSLLKPMPTNFIRETSDYSRFGFFDVTVQSPDLYIPILPMRYERKLIFPNGTFRGVFFSEEIKLAEIHGYKILEVHRGMEFERDDTLFHEFINYFYNQRKTFASGTAGNYIAKERLNTLYGKFGESEEREQLKVFTGDEKIYDIFHSMELYEKTGLITVKKVSRRPYMLAHIAAACTSWGRIHMNSFYQPYGEKIFYTDTDCIKGNLELKTGNELGDMKLEKENYYGYYRAPKMYYEESQGKTEKHCKGFPKKFVNELTLDHFKHTDLFFTQNKFATLRTSLIRHKEFLSLVDIKKATKSGYTKRRIMPHGDTEPWVIREGKIENVTN